MNFQSCTYLLTFGSTFIFGSLFAKVCRVFMIFSNLNFNGKVRKQPLGMSWWCVNFIGERLSDYCRMAGWPSGKGVAHTKQNWLSVEPDWVIVCQYVSSWANSASYRRRDGKYVLTKIIRWCCYGWDVRARMAHPTCELNVWVAGKTTVKLCDFSWTYTCYTLAF